ncbi:dCTP pyrophosphatase 1 isoform X2 [Hemicordylus capensis]|uniref:dCTP pyrophosphatase 1 isoform X2 n=1 Tax=Hemicordylus capensis TaxID=884348 RepID=UPI0023043565|nr:dCTP pyrophosphatase 1 isoform X2 [Hemicordylus capensis]
MKALPNMSSSMRDKCGEEYCKDWEEEKDSKDWFQPLRDEDKATHRFCKCEMHAHHSDLQQHMGNTEQKMNVPSGSSAPLADAGLSVLKLSGTTASTCPVLHPLASSTKIKEEKIEEVMVGNGPGSLTETFQFSTTPTLEDIRSIQSAFATERGWGKYHQPRNLLLALVGEVGELAELFQWREDAPEGLLGWTASEREALSDELSDVLIYLVALAAKCRVDLPSAALRKIEKNRLKYPAEQVYGSSKKYTEYQK